MYLITEEQFIQVVRQENGLHPEDESFQLDLNETKGKGELVINTGWYGRVMCLGESEGFPIFTFTSPIPYNERSLNSPRENYLGTIGRGIRQSYGFSSDRVIDYFLKKPGVMGNWTKDDFLDKVDLKG
jgi:hypothetical protein